MKVLCKCSILHDHDSEANYCGRSEWILLRGIKLMVFDLGKGDCFILPPSLRTLLTNSKNVSHINSPCCAEFLQLIEQEGLTTSSLKLTACYDQAIVVSIVSALGGVISLDTKFGYYLLEQTAATIAACSPGLKRINAAEGSQINPIVENCELDSIHNYYCGNVLEELSSSFHISAECDLRRASASDAHTITVCGKLFHITGLYIDEALPREVEALSPCLQSLETLYIACESYELIGQIAEKCFRLTSLELEDTKVTALLWDQLLRNSSGLCKIKIKDVGIDPLMGLESIIHHCKRLTSLSYNPCHPENMDNTILKLLEVCDDLVELLINNNETVSAPGAFSLIRNVQSLHLGGAHVGVRLLREIKAGLRHVTLSTGFTPADCDMNTILVNSPDLRKLHIDCNHRVESNSLAKLAEKLSLVIK